MNTTLAVTGNNVASMQINHARQVERVVKGHAVMDGAGVKINRILGQSLHKRLDPFLMLDAFRSDNPNDYLAGFPEHPHRGFETVTYMIAGRMRHHDSAGHQGLLQNGGVQWMNAGRGIIHSEMPEQQHGEMAGFQLWLNLPAEHKMSAPWYKDLAAETIPSFTTDSGVTVKVIAGSSHGVTGAMTRPHTDPLYLDLQLAAASHFAQTLPAAHNSFVCVFNGAVSIGDTLVSEGQMAILENGPATDGVIIHADQAARVLLIAGHPLNEPIVQHGPFVMNTQEEIEQTLRDYRDGLFGG